MKTKDIYDFYESNDEDIRLRRTRVNNIEFLTTVKYLENLCPPQSKILDACAGTGIYAFYLGNKGHRVIAGDLANYNVNQIRKRQKTNPVLEEIYTGSILDLSMFDDESFDIVLNLGSFYHLTDEKDRIKSIQESLRVLKPNGLYFLSYINRYANIIKYREQMKEDFHKFEEYLKEGYWKEDPLFYASTPEKIEFLMYRLELEQLHNIATDGMKFVVRDVVNSFNDNEFEKWMNIHYKTCEVKSILGYSEHGLYIGRKQ